jgi:Ca2+-binding EF-hand superfamily protein
MKIHLLSVALAALTASPALAQPASPDGPPATRAAIQQSIQQRFAARDANHDGFLTADELGENGATAIARMDNDHDGKISLAEASAIMLGMFDAADTNHDGTLSQDERTAAMAAAAAAQGQ